ncbi:hypothetical protein [Cryobacterium zhongshanensis]|uniref:Uncharacterized protein n=1 Tax=Cryobacterium zhongshanensis TaxID=2928153 RepID=A0AA41QWS1_9MICO|nr:hypothetical protein [Cryobacterium zhongshanensis]MCI4658443.1 hypothetical protein [Cryobacterium zhongshanensis]
MTHIPTTRESIRTIWDSGRPEYDGVTDAVTAGKVLTDLVRAALDILAYRRLAWAPDAIQLVSNDRESYLRYEAGDDVTADLAVLLSLALSGHAVDGIALGDIMGGMPPWISVRILILASPEGASMNRLDLDPEGPCKVSWYGPFDGTQFSEIATGFALYLTHLVANVFDDDEGEETFEESFEWVL